MYKYTYAFKILVRLKHYWQCTFVTIKLSGPHNTMATGAGTELVFAQSGAAHRPQLSNVISQLNISRIMTDTQFHYSLRVIAKYNLNGS